MQPPGNTRSITIFAGFVQPSHSSGDAAFVAFAQRFGEIFAYAVFAAHAVEEGRLDDSGDAHGRGGEEDAEGGVGTDEEVLDWSVRDGFFFSFSFLFSFFSFSKRRNSSLVKEFPGKNERKKEKYGEEEMKNSHIDTLPTNSPESHPSIPKQHVSDPTPHEPHPQAHHDHPNPHFHPQATLAYQERGPSSCEYRANGLAAQSRHVDE